MVSKGYYQFTARTKLIKNVVNTYPPKHFSQILMLRKKKSKFLYIKNDLKTPCSYK